MLSQAESTELKVLFKGSVEFQDMPELAPRIPFDGEILRFLASLSESIRNCEEAKKYPDIMAFAFFIRSSQLTRFALQYGDLLATNTGRGVTFHIAPSNVPIMFAYTLIAGLLSGNACIVRVSERQFPQVRIICESLHKLLNEPQHHTIANYVAIVRYGHDLKLNMLFSSLCDVRIIWGGDHTISEVRQAVLPPKSYEMVFPNRYSISVIRADSYLDAPEKMRLANSFYNDTYLFDQGACSSPRLLYWVGDADTVLQAQSVFWDYVYRVLEEKSYSNEAITTVAKYMTVCRVAIDTGAACRTETPDNRLVRIRLESIDVELLKYDCVGGVYFEYRGFDLNSLPGFVDRRLQTVTCVGFEPADLRQFFVRSGVTGVDRIVRLGEAGNFSFTWDGYDMIRHMSRQIVAQ